MPSSSIRGVAAEIFFLIILSVLAAVVVNSVSPSSIPWVADRRAETAKASEARGIGAVAPAEALALQRTGQAVFVDAREAELFAEGHIAGALNVSLDPLGEDIGVQASRLPKDKPLVVYCSDLACPKARELAEALKSMGFRNLRVMLEGMEGWKAVGGPVEAGS